MPTAIFIVAFGIFAVAVIIIFGVAIALFRAVFRRATPGRPGSTRISSDEPFPIQPPIIIDDINNPASEAYAIHHPHLDPHHIHHQQHIQHTPDISAPTPTFDTSPSPCSPSFDSGISASPSCDCGSASSPSPSPDC